jgi:hypothetical protein
MKGMFIKTHFIDKTNYFDQQRVYENNTCNEPENCSHGYFNHQDIFPLLFILERNQNIYL